MTKESLAALLNGREYGEEITDAEEAQAKSSGLVAIFGASDDLCELRGAINDEVGAYEGAAPYVSADGKLLIEVADDDEDTLKTYGVLDVARDRIAKATRIDVEWCKVPGYSWTLTTNAPHATFDIMEGADKFCRGIVVDLKEIAGIHSCPCCGREY